MFFVIGCGTEKLDTPKPTKQPDVTNTESYTPSGFRLEHFGNGDAKFFCDGIITGKGHLMLLGLDGNIKKEYDDLAVNWIDGIEEEGLDVYEHGESAYN